MKNHSHLIPPEYEYIQQVSPKAAAVEEFAALHEKYASQQRILLRKAVESGDWEKYVMLHEKPYQFGALSRVEDKMADRTYWNVVGQVWTNSENIWQNLKGWRTILASPRGQRQSIMSPRERGKLSLLPTQLLIYRGGMGKNSQGLSWTTSREVGLWFAKRFAIIHKRALLITGKCDRANIIAFFDNREESEVVILPENVLEQQTTTVDAGAHERD